MITCKCIQKFRDKHGKITSYRLQDINSKTQDITPENLKQAIASNKIYVANLKLTSDNRLVSYNKCEKTHSLVIVKQKIT